jgi:hypothetical protein
MDDDAAYLVRTFEEMKKRSAKRLNDVRSGKFSIIELTPNGNRDVTADQRDLLIREIDHLQKAIDYLKSHQ